MINLIPIHKLIGAIAAVYAAILLTVNSFVGVDIVAAFKLAFVLEVSILLAGYIGWEWLWRWFPKLNTWIFPDLNGEWSATIHWVWNGDSGEAKGVAKIKQTLFKISIEVDSTSSDSETKLVVARRDAESGRPLLHYIYTGRPKQMNANAGTSYDGAALLKVNFQNPNRLEGDYFTSRRSSGRFQFDRRSLVS